MIFLIENANGYKGESLKEGTYSYRYDEAFDDEESARERSRIKSYAKRKYNVDISWKDLGYGYDDVTSYEVTFSGSYDDLKRFISSRAYKNWSGDDPTPFYGYDLDLANLEKNYQESLKEGNSKSLPPEEVLKKIFPQAKFDMGDSETHWISNPETTVHSDCDEKIIKVLKKYGYEEEKGVTMDGQYYYYRPGTHKSEGVQFNTTDVFDSLKDPRCYWDENDEYFTSKDGKICGELFGVAWFNTDDGYDDYDDDPFADDDLDESLSSDHVKDYQEWVDYDMKHYGKISDQTMREIKEAGFTVVKDKYGDYEVVVHEESLKESASGTRKQQLINNIEELVGEYLNGIYDNYYEPFKSDEELIDYVYSQLFDFKSDGGGHTRYGKGICDDLKYLGKNYIVSEIIRIGHDEGIVEDTIEECDNMKVNINEEFELEGISFDRVVDTLGTILSEVDMSRSLERSVQDLYFDAAEEVDINTDELIGVLGQVLDEANITDGSVLGEISDLYLELIKKSGYDR